MLRRFVKAVVTPSEAEASSAPLVWDTSALSHAFEDFAHAAVSAYSIIRDPAEKRWDVLEVKLRRRIDSESLSRKLILACSRRWCFVPPKVFNEVRAAPQFELSTALVFGEPQRVEEVYVRRERKLERGGDPRGFSKVWSAFISVKEPRPETVRRVKSLAQALGKNISDADAEAIALAYDTGGILVTADRNAAEVADTMGVKVLYTIGRLRPHKTWR